MENLLLFISVGIQLVAANNWVMSFAKQFSAVSKTSTSLRFMLVVLSLVGVLSANALAGDAIDLNRVTDIVIMFFQTGGLAFASHWSYKTIKEA